jgi:NADPH2 dehydrogenase
MEKTQINRHSTLVLNNKIVLNNRIVVPPMASTTATESGFVTGQTLNHYQRLATSGAALVFVEYTYVHPSGRSEKMQLGISNDEHVAGLKDLSKIIKASGAVAGIQLTHSGGKSNSEFTIRKLMGPSGIVVPVKDQVLETPKVMDYEDILLWKNAFALAIQRAIDAGFDVIELHSAHGYGLNQFLSAITNVRNDAYGGSVAGRSQLLIEIIEAAKVKNAELVISARLPGQDFIDGGFSSDDAIWLAQKLQSIGVSLIHVSSGLGGWRRPMDRKGEGYLVDEAEKIQSQVSIPVIGVGGISTGSYIDESLKKNRFELAAVGRAILKDPKAWNEKQMWQTTK